MPAVGSHQIWASGHIIMLISSLRILSAYTIGLFSSGSISGVWYRVAYLGALLSYAIVIYKSLGVPSAQNLTPYIQRALADDNVQYAILGFFWFVSRPVYISLIPFATFSLFHTLTFIRTNILPKFVAPPAAARAGAPQVPPTQLQALGKRIQIWVKSNYDSAMRFVAYTELVILAWVSLKAITWQGALTTPLFLIQFLRMRYFASPFTREAVGFAVSHVDNIVAKQSPAIQGYYRQGKTSLSSILGGNLVQTGGPAPVNPAGGGAAGAGAGAGAAPRRG